jgi:hypothetical protein
LDIVFPPEDTWRPYAVLLSSGCFVNTKKGSALAG